LGVTGHPKLFVYTLENSFLFTHFNSLFIPYSVKSVNTYLFPKNSSEVICYITANLHLLHNMWFSLHDVLLQNRSIHYLYTKYSLLITIIQYSVIDVNVADLENVYKQVPANSL